MITNRFSITFLGILLVSAAAFAQTNVPGPITTTAAPATSGKFLSQVEPEKWRTFRLKGLDVYNSNKEHVGDIRELLQDRGGKIEAVVIGVGGFLGMGERDVALPYDEIQWIEKGSSTTGSTTDTTRTAAPNKPNESVSTTGTVTRTTNVPGPSYPDHAVIKVTKEQLKAAPVFKIPD